jgi:glutathione synthase/RimK-type ligase-like ATP-grasp enzyme
VIGGRLTEVNVTSPTGVQEVNALENAQLEAASRRRQALVGRSHL